MGVGLDNPIPPPPVRIILSPQGEEYKVKKKKGFQCKSVKFSGYLKKSPEPVSSVHVILSPRDWYNEIGQSIKLQKKGKIIMPKGKRRTYTKEFKLDAVSKKINNIYRTNEICEKYQIDRQTLCRWVNEYKAGGEAAFEAKAVLEGEELRKLKQRVKDLEMENEILKKAEAYFALRNQRK